MEGCLDGFWVCHTAMALTMSASMAISMPLSCRTWLPLRIHSPALTFTYDRDLCHSSCSALYRLVMPYEDESMKKGYTREEIKDLFNHFDAQRYAKMIA